MNPKEWRRRQLEERERAQAERLEAIAARRAAYGTRLTPACRAAALAVDAEFRRDPELACAAAIAVRATFADGFCSDTVLLVKALAGSVPAARVRMGGEVVAIEASELALPQRLVYAAEHTLEYRMCSWKPLAVGPYLTPAFSRFFRCGPVRGVDLAEFAADEASLDEYRRGGYQENEIRDEDVIVVEASCLLDGRE